jgi:tRNA threonylcarbamoyladenosine biosynthesis protein TsaE
LQGGEVLALFGELGTGKTVLVRGIAAGLEAPPCSVSSPTFVLVHEYRGKFPLIHADLYRLESPGELDQLGLSDYVDGRHVLAVEWAEKAGSDLPDDRLEVHLGHQSNTVRTITMKATGTVSRSLLARVRKQGQADAHSQSAHDRERRNR